MTAWNLQRDLNEKFLVEPSEVNKADRDAARSAAGICIVASKKQSRTKHRWKRCEREKKMRKDERREEDAGQAPPKLNESF